MDSEQERRGDLPDQAPSPSDSGPPAKKGCGLFFARLFVGAVVSFVFMSVLYGPGQAVQIVGLAVICTAGLSLIVILPMCWVVGWIVMAAWRGVSGPRGVPSAS